MKKEMIVRAWKDPEFRSTLTAEERDSLPESPSGRSLTELDEVELGRIIGGAGVPVKANTGCADGSTPTCGIIVCDLATAQCAPTS